jgi:cell wall-associated NlpC family hydrolase
MVHRRRRRYRRPRGRITGWQVAAAIACGGLLAVAAHHGGTPAQAQAGTVTTGRAAVAIAYARAQLGKPYLWGGTGPDAFDCSGLVMQAWAAAGVSIPRTSQEQWAALPHIPASQARPGDLVFFPGSDGSWAAPGHVALVLSATTMLQAYAIGTPIEISPLNGNGAGGIVGFARPDGA